MTQLIHEFERFVLHDAEKSVSTVHISIAQPTPLEVRTFGRLFILFELNSASPMSSELIATIEDEMRRAYYQGPQLRLETAFEQALQHVNGQLKRLIESGATDWLENFNIVIGVLKDRLLILTHIGDIRATLIHRGRMIDIIETAGPEDKKINPLKIFSNIISGEVHEEDYLICFAPSLLDYLSQEKLKRIVLDRTPIDAVRHLEELLQDASPRTPFAALISHATPNEETETETTTFMPSPPVPLPVQTQSSMDSLIQRERSTQQLLTPSIWLIAKRFVSSVSGAISQFLSSSSSTRRTGRNWTRDTQPHPHIEKPSPLAAFGQHGLRSLAVVSTKGGRVIGQTLKGTLSRRGSFFATLRSLPRIAGRQLARVVSTFPRWSFTRKVLFLATIALLFFFAQSIVMLGRNNDTKKNSADRQAAVTQITEKINQAEAALSYDDEVRATKLIAEADGLIATLKTGKTAPDSELSDLISSLDRLREQTQHIVRLDQPKPLAALEVYADENGLSALSFLRGALYVAGAKNNSIIQVAADTGDATEIKNPLADQESYKMSARLANQSVLLFDGISNFGSFTPASDQLRALAFSPANVDSGITGLATYQSRIYLLDSKNNQIFRYQLGADSFGAASAWIQDSERDLSNAISICVDGSVYILLSDGSIRKYTQGRREDFSVQTIDPVLNSGTQLWTDENAKNIYLLDRTGQRLIVLKKSGQLDMQFTSTTFSDLKSLAVDEAGKKAYVLNGNDVYALDLN